MNEVGKVTKLTMQSWVDDQELDAALGDIPSFVNSLPVWNKVRERVGLKPITRRDLLAKKVDHLKDLVTQGAYRQVMNRPEDKKEWIDNRSKLLDAEQALLLFDADAMEAEEIVVPAAKSAVVTPAKAAPVNGKAKEPAKA